MKDSTSKADPKKKNNFLQNLLLLYMNPSAVKKKVTVGREKDIL